MAILRSECLSGSAYSRAALQVTSGLRMQCRQLLVKRDGAKWWCGTFRFLAWLRFTPLSRDHDETACRIERIYNRRDLVYSGGALATPDPWM